MFDCCIFVSEMQRIFCEALVGTPIRFEITQNRVKNEKNMRLELERDLDPFFSIFFAADYHHTHPLLPVFSSLLEQIFFL